MDIGQALSNFADWLIGLLLWIPRKLYEQLMEGFASVINAIPVPDFVAQADSAMASLPSGVIYALSFLQAGPGLAMVISAYIIRFVIRRLPVVG